MKIDKEDSLDENEGAVDFDSCEPEPQQEGHGESYLFWLERKREERRREADRS